MNQLEFFNLNKSGDSAIVRILNTAPDNIEVKDVHRVDVGGKKKVIACLGEKGCPLCNKGIPTKARLYVHLWDYTDNKEKVWDRTPNPNFISSLREIFGSWGDLYNVALRITRDGDEFPKYNVLVMNPREYPANFDKDAIDSKVAYRFSTYRSKDELEQFLKTGVLPDHVKKESNWIPKEEYKKMKEAEKSNKNNSANNSNSSSVSNEKKNSVNADADDDLFM